jgi:1-acyl-sn-glycerol-3-phosphate acyltransferase
MFYLKLAIKENNMHQINLFLRSLLFSVYSIILIFVFSFLCLFSLLFSRYYRHKSLRGFVYLYLGALELICGIHYRVEGLENIPTDRRGIVFSKHQSAWETFFLPTIFHEPAAIAKRELSWIPFFGWGLMASEPIFINRSNKGSAMQQIIAKGKRFIEEGRWILVFPEGTRTPVGHVGKYHLGGARLAAATGAPVVPVAHNAGYFWGRRKFIKQPGTITVVIGPVIESAGRAPDEIMRLAKEWIEATVTRIGGRHTGIG